MVFSRSKKIKSLMSILFVFMFLAAFQPNVMAQEKAIPEDLLALDHQRCMNGCVPGFGEQTCKPLCDCTVGEFKKQLSFESYLDMSVQLTRNSLTPQMQGFLAKVANYCTGELDRKGIEVGEGVEAKPGGTDASSDKP